jgi:hypothetical protein
MLNWSIYAVGWAVEGCLEGGEILESAENAELGSGVLNQARVLRKKFFCWSKFFFLDFKVFA